MRRSRKSNKMFMGYQLRVLLQKQWITVDGFFHTPVEAENYVKRNYSAGVQFKTSALRFNAEPVSVRTTGFAEGSDVNV